MNLSSLYKKETAQANCKIMSKTVRYWSTSDSINLQNFFSLNVPTINVYVILTGADGKRLSVCGSVELKSKSKNNITRCLFSLQQEKAKQQNE